MKKDPEQTGEVRFTKEQLLCSKTLALPRDVTQAVLREEKTYTRRQAKQLVNEYLKRKV